MKKFEVKINWDTHPIAFRYGAIRLLGNYLGKDGYDSTVREVAKLLVHMTEVEKNGGSIAFEYTDAMGFMLMAGVYGGNQETEISLDDAVEAILQDIDTLRIVFECFFEYQPKPKENTGGKTKGRKSPTKKK